MSLAIYIGKGALDRLRTYKLAKFLGGSNIETKQGEPTNAYTDRKRKR